MTKRACCWLVAAFIATLWPCSLVIRAQASPDGSVAVSRLDLEALKASQASVLEELHQIQAEVSQLNLLLLSSGAGRPGGAAGPPRPMSPVSISDAHLKGDKSAKVVIVEYGDFQCQYCAAFARDTLPELERRYVSSGQVVLAFKQLPLSEIHPRAIRLALASECAAAQGKFWEMHDALFADQAHLDEQSLLARAQSMQLKREDFVACLERPAAGAFDAERAAARSLHITGTPTFFVGRRDVGQSVAVLASVVGARDVGTFRAVIDPLLR